jgi:hypothetical protein
LPHLNHHAAVEESGIDLDQSARIIPPAEAACSGFDLDQMRRGVVIESILMTASRPRPPTIRHCPLCGVAMQASKSRENLAEFDTFYCQTCQTTISEKPRPQACDR